MSKKPKKKPPEAVCVVSWRDKNGKVHRNSGPSPFGEDGGGCGLCLLNTMLLLAAPAALVALAVKRTSARVHTTARSGGVA